MRVLITGASGFVGVHLATTLQRRYGPAVDILMTSRDGGRCPGFDQTEPLDVTNAAVVDAVIAKSRPTHVVHLAGLAAVRAAMTNVSLAWQVHLFGTLNVANAILRSAPDCTLVYVGSGQTYGASGRMGRPLAETDVLAPVNAYEVTKAAADLAVGALAAQGLRCIRMRPFNHTGPGQTEAFVAPSFAMQIARIEAGRQPAVISVGNLDAERDFLDVRDVTSAYASALAKSDAIEPGTILNIASGVPVKVSMILERLLALSSAKGIQVENDPLRMRPSETPYFVGDAARARRLLGWQPAWDLDGTLSDVLDHCRAIVASDR